MKVLIIMTGHQHNIEYKYFGQLLDKCKFLSSSDCEIFIHSNKKDNDISENVKYIQNKKTIYITNKNAGYRLGGIEAVGDIIDMLNLKNNSTYDYVIHIHPDVFILNDTKLLDILNDELNTKNVFIVNRSFNDIKSFSFDFFIFKPRLLKFNIFSNYSQWTESPERFINNAILSNNIGYILIERFDNNHYAPRRIDLNFMWHEHELEKIKNYINKKLHEHELNKIENYINKNLIVI